MWRMEVSAFVNIRWQRVWDGQINVIGKLRTIAARNSSLALGGALASFFLLPCAGKHLELNQIE